MAYISTERVKEIRNQLKKTFSEIKFSVVTRHYSSVSVTILSSPYDLLSMVNKDENKPINLKEKSPKDIGYSPVNHYHIAEHWYGKAKEILTKIYEIVSVGHYDRNAGDPFADYCDCTFYINMSIGSWDKHYQIIESKKIRKPVKNFYLATLSSLNVLGSN